MTEPERIAEIARCETCRFREPDPRPEYATSGQCRRVPPQLIVWTNAYGNAEVEQHWPWMDPTDWCGEHQPKEPQP